MVSPPSTSNLADAFKVDNVTAHFLDSPMVPYHEVTATANMKDIPRFGHTGNFSSVFLSDPTRRDDYIVGLFFVSALLLTFFLLWTLVLIGFKFCGNRWCCCCGGSSGQNGDDDSDNSSRSHKHGGVFAGKPFTLRVENPSKEDLAAFHRRTGRTRMAFLIAGGFVILFGILLIRKGFQNVEATRRIADSSLDNIRVLIDDAMGLTQVLRNVGLNATGLRDHLLVELNQDKLCPQDPTYLVHATIGKKVNDNAGSAVQMLTQLGDFTAHEVKQLEDGLKNASVAVDDIDVVVEAAADKQWIGILYALPLVFLAAIMMAGAMAAQGMVMTDLAELCLSWFILPWFALWIVLAYVLCALFALAATTNADFCAGGADLTPDSTILMSLQNAGISQSETVFEVARYYIRQCTAEAEVDPFLFLRIRTAEIEKGYSTVNELRDSISGVNVDELAFQCGRDFGPLRSLLDTMLHILNSLDKSANSGLKLLSCERIVPIYTDIVYDGTCNTSVTGLAWIFSCLLIVSIMGMTMLTLRSSFKNNFIVAEVAHDPTDEDSELNDIQKLGTNSRSREQEVYDLHFQEHQWASAAMRQRTCSDSESVYTNRNGDVPDMDRRSHSEFAVVEIDPRELPIDAYPTSYHSDDDDYYYSEPVVISDDDLHRQNFKSQQKPVPSAPHESQLYRDCLF